MSNVTITKKKLSILRRANAKEVLYDVIKLYMENIAGREVDEHLLQMVDDIAGQLENDYLQQIPKKQPKVKHYDLEDMVKDIRQLEKEQLEKAFKNTQR